MRELATVGDGCQHSTSAVATQLSVVINLDGWIGTRDQRADRGVAPGHTLDLDVHVSRSGCSGRGRCGSELPGAADLDGGVCAIVGDLQVLGQVSDVVAVFTLQQVAQVDLVTLVRMEVLDHVKA